MLVAYSSVNFFAMLVALHFEACELLKVSVDFALVSIKAHLPVKGLRSLLSLPFHLLQPVHVEASGDRGRFWPTGKVPGGLRDPAFVVR